jgi:ferredoxin--NADP+ reductase
VVDAGVPIPGLYVAGWIKRGPTGIIGTNKKDAVATVASLLADAEAGVLPGPSVDPATLLTGRTTVSTDGWRSIDAAEQALGAEHGRPRTTIHDRDDLLRRASGG